MKSEQIKKDLQAVWAKWHGGTAGFSVYAEEFAQTYAVHFEAKDDRIKALERERELLTAQVNRLADLAGPSTWAAIPDKVKVIHGVKPPKASKQ